MNRLLIVLVLVVVSFGGLGYYLGWFRFTSDSVDGKGHFGVTVDKDKFHQDEQKALDKVEHLGHSAKETAPGSAEKSKE